jgi:hypothetical protein
VRRKFSDVVTLKQAARILNTHEQMLLPYAEDGTLPCSCEVLWNDAKQYTTTGDALYRFGKMWRQMRIDNEEDESELLIYRWAKERRIEQYEEWRRQQVVKCFLAWYERKERKSQFILIKSEVS